MLAVIMWRTNNFHVKLTDFEQLVTESICQIISMTFQNFSSHKNLAFAGFLTKITETKVIHLVPLQSFYVALRCQMTRWRRTVEETSTESICAEENPSKTSRCCVQNKVLWKLKVNLTNGLDSKLLR